MLYSCHTTLDARFVCILKWLFVLCHRYILILCSLSLVLVEADIETGKRIIFSRELQPYIFITDEYYFIHFTDSRVIQGSKANKQPLINKQNSSLDVFTCCNGNHKCVFNMRYLKLTNAIKYFNVDISFSF